jgi:type VI protein secretion system component Hcp
MSAEEANRIARTAERLRRGTRLPLKVLLPTAAALGAGGALAAAAIPGSGGVITACYNTQTAMVDAFTTADGTENEALLPLYGGLRVIDPNASSVTDTVLFQDTTTAANAYVNACAPGETTITWNQQGATGPQGPAGGTGQTGAAGQDGSIDGAATFEIDAGGGTELFAKLAKISGTAKVEGKGGLIELKTFAFGAESPVLGTSKGSGVSKQTVQTFEFTKTDDKTDADLFQDWQQGKTISTMEVQAAHTGKGATTDAATFTFSDVKLKSIQQKGGQETVVGVFTKMQSSFGSGTSKVEGSLNPGGAVTYDLQTSKTG